MALPCPPNYIIDNQVPFKEYQFLPFKTSQVIQKVKECSSVHPGRDFLFNGASFNNTTVYAIESGVVQWALPGYLGILGNDKFVTEYVHVQPLVSAGKQVNAGDAIANLAQLGQFDGTPIPHVHINRIFNWQGASACAHVFTCNWRIKGIGTSSPDICSNPNGWGLVNGVWVFCQNGVRKGGWFPVSGGNSFFADKDGIWSGFIKNNIGNIQYRYLRDRNLPASDPNVNRVAKGWVCSLGQWWYFDNNGNMVSNTTINGRWQLGSNGACTNCGSCNSQS
ncbi:M23 family metallopeptidase [Bacillus thuringiensis]|uniref:M23 family metallopeptidase n=1 Tax=Bacillus thuringiensis TaxID=1428 RepID=UPI000279360D|nr:MULTISPECIES: M23 family metallopeptidase [Bacillus cereus group]EJQ14185.1 hypothetical protein IE5_05800 [Bacillus cereus BAG3X2-2]